MSFALQAPVVRGIAPRQPAKRASVQVRRASQWADVEMAPPDPILGVTEAFKACEEPDKLNLGVGAYRTDELKPYVLEVVRKAEQSMLEKGDNKEYLPIDGLASFKKATVDLLLGADNPAITEGRVAVIQSLSGTGSLRVGAAFLNRFLNGRTVYLSNPTWGNHKNIFNDAQVPWKTYRYFDPETVGLDFEGMCADIAAADDGSIILLHGCAHNPTGVDPTKEQWEKIADLCVEKSHLPFFDVAYQGFATGSLEEDAYAPRYFVSRGLEIMVAQSYSKNLGLYGERVGALSFVCSDKDTAARCLSQMKKLARPMYSNPPVHGARIVSEPLVACRNAAVAPFLTVLHAYDLPGRPEETRSALQKFGRTPLMQRLYVSSVPLQGRGPLWALLQVVNDEEMFGLWKKEMEMMAGRIMGVRQQLYDALVKLNPDKDWSFVTRQIGMFSFTGLNPAQVENMTNKWHIYMTKDGRISLAGLSSGKVEYLAQAIDDSVRNC